jgi:hypothetical protein
MKLLLPCLYFVFVLCTPLSAFTFNEKDCLTDQLEAAINARKTYEAKKLKRIAAYKSDFIANQNGNASQKEFTLCNQLFEEYKSFIYDSAFSYARQLLMLAYKLHAPPQINYAKVKISFTLLSGGMFKESLDTLGSIDVDLLSKDLKVQYFSVYARTFYDMADYSNDKYYAPIYNAKGDLFLKAAIDLSGNKTNEQIFLLAWQQMRQHEVQKAIQTFQNLLKDKNLTEHEKAISYSSLSYMYRLTHDTARAIRNLTLAAVSDMKASIRETNAIRDLAELLYDQKEIRNAYRYVKIALEDAYFYGAKHRKIQIANILPIIEGTQLKTVEGQKKNLLYISIVMALLSVLLIFLAKTTFHQVKKIKQVRNALQQSHEELQNINLSLQDANAVKEEYIGQFFKVISEYIDKIEKLKVTIGKKVMQKKLDDIGEIINNISLKKEREQLYLNFDATFLKIFPGFIEKFNALLHEEARYQIMENEPMPPELRIFALIRLGIADNEKIAKVLDYSVNTIYTYKTKVKKKSTLSNELFEEHIMKIRAL